MSKEIFNVIIAGSRKFDDYELLKNKLDNILAEKVENPLLDIVIVSGRARGADALGEKYAKENGFKIVPFPAEWKNMDSPCVAKVRYDGTTYNALAGAIRNRKMGEYADALVIFWDGKSTGTKDMLDIAKELNLPYRIILY